jgi:hypothetical protein
MTPVDEHWQDLPKEIVGPTPVLGGRSYRFGRHVQPDVESRPSKDPGEDAPDLWVATKPPGRSPKEPIHDGPEVIDGRIDAKIPEVAELSQSANAAGPKPFRDSSRKGYGFPIGQVHEHPPTVYSVDSRGWKIELLEVRDSCFHVSEPGCVSRLPQPWNRPLAIPIDGDYATRGPDPPRKIKRRQARPATQIHQRVAFAESGSAQQPLVLLLPHMVLDLESMQLFVTVSKRVLSAFHI